MTNYYGTLKVGDPKTLEHRIYVTKNGTPISSFHDIPLYCGEEQTSLNMVVEIPRWTNDKLEITRDEPLNPIKQDTKGNSRRYVHNCFPYKGYIWNYGAFPQTWEDPSVVHPDTQAKGDNDPLDVCEIGQRIGYPGEVKQVKFLGILALLDGEDTDWKVVAIDINDPLAPKLNDIGDVDVHMPGLLQATKEWFRIYKIPDGKPPNNFSLNGEYKNKIYAGEVIEKCSHAWHDLIYQKSQNFGIATANLTVEGSPGHISRVTSDLLSTSHSQQEPIVDLTNESKDMWYFIK